MPVFFMAALTRNDVVRILTGISRCRMRDYEIVMKMFAKRKQKVFNITSPSNPWASSRGRQPEPAAVMTGCGSYLIQPRFFDESLWDYSQAPRGAFYMDDIWISGWLSRCGVKRYVVPASAMMRSVWRQRRTLSLHDVPEGRQYHNNETIAFFGNTWDVFASD